ncbi:MAG: hypothetical protein JKY65_17630 [Planctomycetes bacterium]|nr:hypothetical protein [Planctomycetota bacterium]
MGLILSARCEGCGYEERELRLGTTHSAIDEHDVEVCYLFPATCCGRVQSVALLLGMPLPTPPCVSCGEPLVLEREKQYRIARLSGDVLKGHPCPACSAETLSFCKEGQFR